MNNRKLWVSIMAWVLIVVMVVGLVAGAVVTIVSGAKTSTEIKEEIKELKEQQGDIKDQLKELEGQRKENLSEMKDIVAQKNNIDQQISLIYEQMDVINQQIDAYNAQIAEKQEQLEQAEARLEELNEKNKERIRAMEEDGAVSYWSVLFKANSFADLLDRLNMISEIAAADKRRLDEMSKVAEQIAAAKGELVHQKAALQESKRELDEAQVELEAKRAEADGLLAALNAKGEEYNALIEDAEDANSALLEELAKKEVELDEAEEREYKEWLAQQKPGAGTTNTVDGITWLVPCNYTRLTSPYGNRIHPVYKIPKFHNGVDLAAPLNTPIYATRGGIIKTATYNSSAGNYVSIDHRDGFTSSYLHLTRYIVKVGDWVAPGQLIGYMGSTGTSTGSHLHFSIYKNGSTVNPVDYVKLS